MAKRKADGVNKSAAVRELLEQSPKMKVKEIVAALAGKGIKVAPQLVYAVKTQMKVRKRKAKRQQVAQMVQSAGGSGSLTVELLQRVKTLAQDAGGYGKLKELVDVLAQ